MGYNLEGKVAIITGSGRGIGESIAIVLAKEGAKIITAFGHRLLSTSLDISRER